MKPIAFALAACLLAANTGATADPLDRGDLLTLPTRPGVTQAVFVESPTPTPAWVIVLFGGTPGALHLDASGATTLKGNFLIRSARHWIDWGEAVALVDTPSDKADGVDGFFRLSRDSFVDTQAVVAALRQRFPHAKLALVGTSAGTVSVGNALQRDPTLADAFVLTSPVAAARGGRGGGMLADLEADGTKYRVLVVSNPHDECPASPAYAGKRLAEHNRFDFVEVDSNEGSGDRATQCGGHSPHGFLGAETTALGVIRDWLAGRPVAAK